MKNKLFFLLVLALCLGTAACNKQLPDTDANHKPQIMDKVEYRFRDSSTPPRYHRSYTITVTPNEVRTVIDVYGTILADSTEATAPGKFEELQKAAAKLESPKEKETVGATGTKGRRISLYRDGERIYYIYWDSLQKVKPGTEKYARLVQSASSSLGQLLLTPFPEGDD